MSKVKYKFNTKSLTYEKVKVSWRERVWKILSYLATGLVFSILSFFIITKVLSFATPTEKQKDREVRKLKDQYEKLLDRMKLTEEVLADLQERDNNVYRVIFEAEPIDAEIRKGGFGGVDRYKRLEGYDNSQLMIETTKALDKLSKQIYIQSKSFDEVIKMAKNKEQLINSIPAIMPISSKFLRHAPGGFGWRTHPIYKSQEFHPGMDFAAPEGTPIYATGDGVVERADNTAQGYGNHVVLNHSYGYQTLYGHMTKMAVKVGQKIKRGQVIGYVGSTGLSTAPHVHYEVIKNGEKMNPVNFYYNDLSPEEYQIMLELSQRSSQSFD